MKSILSVVAVLLAAPVLAAPAGAAEPPIRVLFLGDQGHHRPAERFAQVDDVLAARGIELEYTEDLGRLTPEELAKVDVLAVYANITNLPPAAEGPILEFVRGGKGLVPLHCASFCFQNSPAWIDLVGAQFQRHGAGEFRTVNVAAEHPVMKGFGGFESWDETYVHTKHNPRGRTVLEERVEGEHREPWTWVRQEGAGRVFYTAWGHDERTWGHPGFHNLVERGIRFAAGRDPAAAGPYLDKVMARPSVLMGTAKDGFPNDGPWYRVIDTQHWYVAHAGSNGAGPPGAAMSGFLGQAWLCGAPAARLDDWTDVPWCQADYWYIEKCAAAVNAYGKAGWTEAK